jgi:hypothetical protein
VLRLAPGGEALDTLTINVPGSASSGERYAVVWAAVSAPPAAAGGITLVNRVGVRMYLSIGPGGAPASNFTIGSLTAERSATGAALVVANVHNNGQSTLDLSGSLTLSKGPGGLHTDPSTATLGTVLAPGVSEPVTVQLASELPRGPWRADLSLTSGLLQRSAVATITFPLNSRAAKAPKAAGVPDADPRRHCPVCLTGDDRCCAPDLPAQDFEAVVTISATVKDHNSLRRRLSVRY